MLDNILTETKNILSVPTLVENTSRKSLLEAVMNRAGFNTLTPSQDDLTTSKEEAKSLVDRAEGMVLVLHPDYGPAVDDSGLVSIARHYYKLGIEKLKTDSNFKIFIWHHPELLEAEIDIFQQEFINEIRYSLTKSMVFSSVSSPIQFVEDMRSMMEDKKVESFDVSNAEIFLIFNEVDEEEASNVVDLLSDIIEVEKLNIVQDNDVDYAELCSQQINQSKLAVVYFKETADWALPFTQQIWKKVGGAASHTPILFIGDENPEYNLGKKFNAPKIISLILSGELIPLEIKVQYDKITSS